MSRNYQYSLSCLHYDRIQSVRTRVEHTKARDMKYWPQPCFSILQIMGPTVVT